MKIAAAPVHSNRGAGERAIAVLLMLTLLVQVPGFALVPAAVFPALFLAVPLLSTAPRTVRLLAGLAGFGVVSGAIVLWVSVSAGMDAPEFETWASVVLWLAAIPLLPAAAVWAMRRLSPRSGILLMLAGGIVGAAGIYGAGWKGSFGIFVTAFVLVLLARHGALSCLALFVAVVLSFAFDARSMAVAASAALLVQLVLREKRETGSWWARGTKLVISLTVIVIGSLWALGSGLAGSEVQVRTLDQLSRANVIFGVRAEWASTISLYQHAPFGYGFGVQPSAAESRAAITAVQAAGGDWTAVYFSRVVLGERVDLHSMTANLWFHFGIGGVLVAALLAVILFRGIRDSSASTRLYGMGGVFMILMAGWDLLFTPMADVPRLIAGVVIALSVVQLSRREEGDTSPSVIDGEAKVAVLAHQRRISPR
ncbi:MAG: hypothetical protein K0S37_4325 [Microbacterium sp.]|jgi:hypothetical protein|nr:hypothetical protein [Microbacterium sp.]